MKLNGAYRTDIFQLIAIAGTIGTGLFLGAGENHSNDCPSVIFAYILIGIAMFFFLKNNRRNALQRP